jgi:hypothetical protein
MNAVSSSRLSSPRTSRIIFWLGAALLVAALVVFIINKSHHNSSNPAAAKSAAAQVKQAKQLIQHPERKAQVAKNADWAKIPASAKVAVKTFIVDGAGERNLAAAYPVTTASFRQGFTLHQWVHGDSLPFQVFPEMNFKVPMSFTLTQWDGKNLLADVGVDSKYTTGRVGYIFSVGAAKVGKRWLVNYWFPKYTPPVRAIPGAFGSGG